MFFMTPIKLRPNDLHCFRCEKGPFQSFEYHCSKCEVSILI